MVYRYMLIYLFFFIQLAPIAEIKQKDQSKEG